MRDKIILPLEEGYALNDPSVVSTIVLMVVLWGMIYFTTIKPENKRKKDAQSMRESLKEGEEITTIGGITGKICAVKETTIVFETGADRVRLEVAKWAVAQKGMPNANETSTR